MNASVLCHTHELLALLIAIIVIEKGDLEMKGGSSWGDEGDKKASNMLLYIVYVHIP